MASNLDTMHPRLRILHCFEYGRYGMTPTIDRADDVLHAYAMISSSIILLFTSLHIVTGIKSIIIKYLAYVDKDASYIRTLCPSE